MLRTVREHRLASAVVVALVAGLGAWLLFGVFGIHTLFIDEVVDEAPPVFTAGTAPSGMPGDAISDDAADAMNKAMEEEGTPSQVTVEEAPAMPEATVVRSGSFIDRSHPTRGTALVITDGNQSFLRLEDFETDNGPDLNVYLSTAPPDAQAGEFDDDFVDLGDLKGNVGSQNYELGPEVDVERHRTVVIWCVRFGVAFGAAALEP